MKSTTILAVAGAITAVVAQTPVPSPTESVGCVAHDDHWHCEGPRETEVAETPAEDAADPESTPAPVEGEEEEHDHDEMEEEEHDHDEMEEGEEEHDHDEMEEEEEHDHEDEVHSDEAGTGSAPPMPTESVGCEIHGDHWHCDGPASEATATTDAASEETDPAATPAATGSAEESEEGEDDEPVLTSSASSLATAATFGLTACVAAMFFMI